MVYRSHLKVISGCMRGRVWQVRQKQATPVSLGQEEWWVRCCTTWQRQSWARRYFYFGQIRWELMEPCCKAKAARGGVGWKQSPFGSTLGGEAGVDSLIWNSSCSKSTQVCELGEPCGKRARRACSLGRFFQVLRALIMMVGEERRFASVPLATCLYGL